MLELTVSSCSIDLPTSESMLLSFNSWDSKPTGWRKSVLDSVSTW